MAPFFFFPFVSSCQLKKPRTCMMYSDHLWCDTHIDQWPNKICFGLFSVFLCILALSRILLQVLLFFPPSLVLCVEAFWAFDQRQQSSQSTNVEHCGQKIAHNIVFGISSQQVPKSIRKTSWTQSWSQSLLKSQEPHFFFYGLRK